MPSSVLAMNSYSRLACCIALMFFMANCYTSKDDGLAMQRDIEALKKQLSKNAKRSQKEQEKLQKIMEQATALLTRNNADVGAQVERIQAQVDKLTGQLEEQEQKFNELSQQFTEFQAKVDVKLEGLSNSASSSKTPAVPEDPNQLFARASKKLNAGEHQEARKLLRHFISRYPSDTRLDRAQFMLGESYYSEQKFAPAIVEYKKIIEKYKRSPNYPDALFKIGMSFYQLKFCADAQLFLRQLQKLYRRHAQVKRAQKVLGLIKRYKRNRSVCRP